MKKLFYLPLIAFMLGACSDEEPVPVQVSPDPAHPVTADGKRTRAEILDIASRAAQLISPSGNEKGLSRGYGRVIDYSTPILPVYGRLSRSAADDALMYVVNYSDNNGFAMVSANTGAPELLAVSRKGNYNPEEGTDLFGFNLWMDETLQMLAIREQEQQELIEAYAGSLTKTVVDTLDRRYVPNRINNAWGQQIDKIVPTACEGLECPNGISGCVNTAIAMAMSFVGRPTELTLSYKQDPRTGKNKKISLRWNELKKYLARPDFEKNDRPVADPNPRLDSIYGYDRYPIRETISELFRQIGIETKSLYLTPPDVKDPVTTALISDCFKVMHAYAITSASGWEEGAGLACYQTMFNNTSCILLVNGKDSNENIGHIWICDGLRYYQIKEHLLESNDGGINWTEQSSKQTELCYVNYNWGLHGEWDGYYLHTETRPKKGNKYADFDFTDQRMVLKVIQ